MSASSSSSRGVVFNKTVKSAFVLQVPEELRAPVDAIRKDYDRSFGRWPPHVNLLYPFVEASTFASAVALIEPILRQQEPFRVWFAEFGSFEHRGSTTVWLRPETDPPNVLLHIHNALRVAFPHCDDLDTKSEHGYTPHMTIAQVKGHSRGGVVRNLQAQFERDWRRLEFRVDAFHLLAREDDSPFVVYYDLPLGAASSQVARAAASQPSTARLAVRPTFRFQFDAAGGSSGSWRAVDAAAEQLRAARQLIVLRGPSGSGKSFAVTEILSKAPPGGVAFSTDDFFKTPDGYVFEAERLTEAHAWNKVRAFAAMEAGATPIVIDNTNLESWEAAPYVKRAVESGYAVEIRDSATPWCRDAAELARRNAHGVPLDRIEQQLLRWTPYTVGDALAAAAAGTAAAAAAAPAAKQRSDGAAPALHSVRILTYNVLLDSPDESGRFDSAILESDARVPCVLEVIERADADIVCLQEITKPILACVLSCGLVRERYFVSDVDGDTVVPYGQVTLAKRMFETSVLTLSSVKRVIGARMRIGAREVLLCNVHFPSSVGKNGAVRRHQQIGSVLSLAEQDAADHVLIVGDTNMEPGEAVTAFDDAWLSLGRTDEQGFTFDPERNPTAKITSVRGVARRYDRVLFKSRRGSILPTAGALAGTALIGPQHYRAARRALPLCPSDHFALTITLSFSEERQNRTQATLARVLEPHSYAHARVVIAAARAAAVLLRAACAERGSPVAVLPYGSLAIGVATADSDVDMLCVGTMPREQFIAIATAALTHAPHCRALRDVSDAVVPVFAARVVGVDVDIAYAQVKSADVVAAGDLVGTLASAAARSDVFVSDEAVRCAAGLFDAHLLLQGVDDATVLNVFRPLARLVRAWARFHGIYSNRFGFIGGFGWCCAVMAVVRRRADASETLEQCARRFFRELAAHDWSKPLGLRAGARPLQTTEAPPTLAVTTPSGQYVARHSTRASRVLVERCFKRAAEVVDSDDVDWFELFVPLPTRATVVFEVSISAGSFRDLRDWYAHVTNRLASFTDRVLKACTGDSQVVCLADERTFSADFALDGPYAVRHYVTLESHSRSLQLNMSSLCAAWLQGLHSWSARKSSMVARIEQRAAMPPNVVALRWSEVDNEDDDFSYHELEDKERVALTAWHQSPADVKLVMKKMVEDLDHVEPAAAAADDDDAADDADNAGASSSDDDAEAAAESSKAPKRDKKKKKGGKKKAAEEEEEVKKVGLRPAHVVYKHILYGGDSGLVASQYHVIWEDRHLGLVDQLVIEYDIENVPLHRVRRFERVLGDGVTREIVWDREARVDKLKK
jgi:2'-5' RNA ligase/endonuclease/exonuclease/phosphatase family metal-dependent hydrolase